MKRVLFTAAIAILATTVYATEWVYQDDSDLLTGNRQQIVAGMADDASGTLETPVIMIRKTGTTAPEVFVYFGGWLIDGERHLRIRFGNGELEPWRIDLSTNGQAAFLRSPNAFIETARTAGSVVIGAERATGGTMAAAWDLDGFASAVDQVR